MPRQRDIARIAASLGEGKVDVQGFGAGRPKAGELAARGELVGIRHVERLAVRQQASRSDELEKPIRERIGVDLDFGHAIVCELRGSEAELDQVFKIEILGLEMLGRKEHSLGPDDSWLALHGTRPLPCVGEGS